MSAYKITVRVFLKGIVTQTVLISHYLKKVCTVAKQLLQNLEKLIYFPPSLKKPEKCNDSPKIKSNNAKGSFQN